ncbi:hypothetical protein BDY17DRAFT_346736 [Neohortaea acidophila]|uniref:Uncharacterized protein n=1 Tax=Neohortaea acidophila TaxID=245834 RepID=A0A6A6PRF1_9PEZI|nr:uncharacterized protein BDY17DRAFT_346736 [Neohortaea acidophila]KAF2482690.1 hypothetical protein BDY17DRAFT_346736 [Neohortaea acidophila]
MPKKRTYNFKPLQGSSSKPFAAQHGHEPTSTVNERLSELRKVEAKDAEAKKRQLAESVAQRSVPPAVRDILGFLASAPPKPKANLRMRERERRRTPGPAPPKSWLAGGGCRQSLRLHQKADAAGRRRSMPLLRFARLAGLEDDAVDERPSTLSHLALKSLAEAWDLLEPADHALLVDVPLRLRLRLISYVGGMGSTIDASTLQILLQGSDPVTCLDLAGLLGQRNLSVRRLSKLLESMQLPSAAEDTKDAIVESWDIAESFQSALTLGLPTARFANLTHLCLSHPNPTVSWRDLLHLSKSIPQITHLSLAYWPRPTLTPNLSTTIVASQHSPDVTAGGSHYYSNLDDDLSEPTSLLRQLSTHLLCLQWLDVEGCEDWAPALGRLASSSDDVQVVFAGDDEWSTSTRHTPTPCVFTSNWKNLHYVRCTQGWVPTLAGISGQAERTRGSGIIDMVIVQDVMKYLGDIAADNNVLAGGIDAGSSYPTNWDTQLDTEKKRARIWLERECRLTYACMQIHTARRARGLKGVEMDLGWIRRHSPPKINR